MLSLFPAPPAVEPTRAEAFAPGLQKSAASNAAAVTGLRSAAVPVAFILPLIVLPGLERPFSTPKFILLGIVVALGASLAAWRGLLGWPALPGAFQAAMAAWLAALGASAALGPYASLDALLPPLIAVGWFLLVMLVRPRPERLALALVGSGAVVASVALLQFLGLDPFALFGWVALGGSDPRMRVYATLGNPNFVAAYLVALVPLTIALRTHLAPGRTLLSIALALEGLAVCATGSRAAALALAAALLWLAVFGRRRRLLAMVVLAGLVGTFVLAFAPSRPMSTTLRGRYYVWQVVAPHLAERPVLGSGPGAFPMKFAEWETERWSTGRASASERAFAGIQDHAHNDYLEILVENGIAGVVGFLAVVICFLAFAFREARRTSSELLTGAAAGVVALLAVALVDFPLSRPAELFAFWTLMAIAYLNASEINKEPIRT